MTPGPTVILDTNLLVSALLVQHNEAPPRKVVELVLAGRIPCLLSPALIPALIDEYTAILNHPEVASRHHQTRAAVRRFLEGIESASQALDPGSAPMQAPDLADQHLWDLLHAVTDSTLVTGDARLLGSRDFPGRVLSPREFVDRYHL